MKAPHSLNFSLLNKIQSSSVLIRPSRDVDEQLRRFLPSMEEFYQRTQAALMFVLKTDAETESWINEAYIRAGLNEFYSLEDAARRAFRCMGQVRTPPTLRESFNPLVHLMYSLRRINVHVKPSTASVGEIHVQLNNPNNLQEFTWDAVMLSDKTESDLLSHGDVKMHYRHEDIKKAMAWVLQNQKAFGIGQVFRQGIEAYCREVLAALNMHFSQLIN